MKKLIKEGIKLQRDYITALNRINELMIIRIEEKELF